MKRKEKKDLPFLLKRVLDGEEVYQVGIYKKKGLQFLLKKVFDEEEDYRVRRYILAWIASKCATLVLAIGAVIFFILIAMMFL